MLGGDKSFRDDIEFAMEDIACDLFSFDEDDDDVDELEGISTFGEILAALEKFGIPRKEVVPMGILYANYKVKVYDNMQLKIGKTVKITHFEDIVSVPYRFSPIVKTYKEERDGRKARKWEDPYSTLTKEKNTTLQKYIKDIIDIDLPDHTLRDLSEKVNNSIHNNITLHPCETVEECVEAHKYGQSCMRVGSSHFGNNSLRNRIFKDLALWPSMFYAFCPQIKVVLIKERGKPIGRTYIFDTKGDGEFDGYGTIYVDYGFRAIVSVREKLKMEGYVLRSVSVKVPFEIPAVKYKNKSICPIISNDKLSYYFYVKYNEKKDIFMFSPKVKEGWRRVGDSYAYQGWMNTAGHQAYL